MCTNNPDTQIIDLGFEPRSMLVNRWGPAHTVLSHYDKLKWVETELERWKSYGCNKNIEHK